MKMVGSSGTVNAGFAPMAVLAEWDFPCPLGPGRSKRRPYGWGARKKSCPSLKSQKSQFKQGEPVAYGANRNWDFGDFWDSQNFKDPARLRWRKAVRASPEKIPPIPEIPKIPVQNPPPTLASRACQRTDSPEPQRSESPDYRVGLGATQNRKP
jgi:hypothetical protein